MGRLDKVGVRGIYFVIETTGVIDINSRIFRVKNNNNLG